MPNISSKNLVVIGTLVALVLVVVGLSLPTRGAARAGEYAGPNTAYAGPNTTYNEKCGNDGSFFIGGLYGKVGVDRNGNGQIDAGEEVACVSLTRVGNLTCIDVPVGYLVVGGGLCHEGDGRYDWFLTQV